MTNHKKVIELKKVEPKTWKFWDYQELGGVSPIEVWESGLSEEAWKLFNGLLKLNRTAKTPLQWVGRGRHFFLEGQSRENRIWELGFQDSDKVQYRVLGIFWPRHTQKEATLLIGCTHKDSVYDPPECIKTANDRRGRLERQEAKLHERKIRTN